MKTPKTDCLLKFKKAKKSITLDSRFVDLWKYRIPYHLKSEHSHVKRSPYLRHLRETADGSHHASTVKQNLCHLLCSAWLHSRYIASFPGHSQRLSCSFGEKSGDKIWEQPGIEAGRYSHSSYLFWCLCQHNCYPLYSRCTHSDYLSLLCFTTIIFQAHLGACCLRLSWLPAKLYENLTYSLHVASLLPRPHPRGKDLVMFNQSLGLH